MASVVAGGLFNAVAFAGAGFLFSHLNKSGYEAEAKRHNKALEQLNTTSPEMKYEYAFAGGTAIGIGYLVQKLT